MNMTSEKTFRIRCRGIILHEGRLLVVRHSPSSDFVALPGGHLEWGEDVPTCIKREIVEELGIEPQIGRLLYVNSFVDEREKNQSIEFFFEILNGKEYVGFEKLERTHAHELAETIWVKPTDSIRLLPEAVWKDFKAGKLLSDTPRYITS